MADAGLASAVPLPVVGYGDLARNGGELGFDFDVCGGHRECRRVGRRTFQFGVAAEDRPFREREVFLGVAVRVIVSPAAADRGVPALAVPVAVVGYGCRVQIRLFRLVGARDGCQRAYRRCVEERGFPKFHSRRGF